MESVQNSKTYIYGIIPLIGVITFSTMLIIHKLFHLNGFLIYVYCCLILISENTISFCAEFQSKLFNTHFIKENTFFKRRDIFTKMTSLIILFGTFSSYYYVFTGLFLNSFTQILVAICLKIFTKNLIRRISISRANHYYKKSPESYPNYRED